MLIETFLTLFEAKVVLVSLYIFNDYVLEFKYLSPYLEKCRNALFRKTFVLLSRW